MDEIEWIKPGLKFQCTGCGKCCTGPSGFVYISNPDLERLASYLQISQWEFILNYTKRVDGMLVLLDRPGTHDCIFLKDNRCSVYEGRPTQCRTFPWWLQNLQTPDAWNRAAEHCEGINHVDAPLIQSHQIEEGISKHLENMQ